LIYDVECDAVSWFFYKLFVHNLMPARHRYGVAIAFEANL